MDLFETLKHVQALIYSAMVNFLLAFSLYFVICQIPFSKQELVVSSGLWFVYFSYTYVFYFLVSILFPDRSKWIFSLLAVITAATTIFTFHYMASGFAYGEPNFIVSVILLLLLSADIPYLVSLIHKKMD